MSEQPGMGEFGLIDWIRRRESGGGGRPETEIGDDCAVVDLRESYSLVTVDMLMDGRHFHLEQDGAEAVGYKAMGVNISDIAAMAGEPRFAVVAVALPRRDAVAVAQGLHEGMRRMADRFGVRLIGGDTNAWDGPLVISVTVLGNATIFGPRRRKDAQVGDAVFVTGPLGGSFFRGRHLRPEPRVTEAQALNLSRIRAMIDLSDGLSSDLGHILEESGNLGAVLDADAIPVHADAIDQSREDGRPPIDHALNDGEDFELCFTIAPEDVVRMLERISPNFAVHRIGEIVAEPGLRLRHADGQITLVEARGFDHLKGGGR